MFASISDLNTTSKVFILATVLESLDVIALTCERIFSQNSFNTVAKVALLLSLATLFMLYFAINGVLSENRFELICYLFVTSLISFCTIYAFVFLGKEDGKQSIVVWIRLISVCIFCPLNFVLGWFTYKAFGWKIYHKIGANITLQSIYRKYQIFVSLLKIDLLFGTGLVLGIGLFQLDDGVTFYIDLAMLPISIGWAMLGLFGVRHEEKISMGFFLSFAVLEPIYIVWKAIGWIHATPSKIGVYAFGIICAAASVALLVRVCLVCFAVIAYSNFEKGLKDVFEKRGHVTTNSEVVPFLQE